MNEVLVDIDSRAMLLERLQKAKGVKVCTDEVFTYYRVQIYGAYLMYRRRSFRPDGRKAYMLNDQLAKCLGFRSLSEMKYPLNRLQYWRRFVSVERLKVAFDNYNRLR